MLIKHAFMLVSQILNPTVAVEYGVWIGLAIFDRPAQSPAREGGCSITTKGPADELARITIHDGGKITPFAAYFQISHIPYPDLIGTSSNPVAKFHLFMAA